MINYVFFVITLSEVCNFADNNTLYSSNKEFELVSRNLESDLNNVLTWFNIDSLKANPGKFQFMVLGTKDADSFVLNRGKNKIGSSTEVTLLGVKIDEQLKFKSHIEELCWKAAYKLHALRRIREYLTVDKVKLLATAFINSQFIYALLIWIFAGTSSIAKFCKYPFEHFNLFMIIMINHIMTYWMSVMMFPSTRSTYDSWQLKFINHFLWTSILSSFGNFSIKIHFYEKEI